VLSQTERDGSFTLASLPRLRPLLFAALYDARGDRGYDPGEDLWGFAETPVVVPASGDSMPMAEIYLAYEDEPGDIAGVVVDSACIGFVSPSALRAEADSIRALIKGEIDATGFEADTSAAPAGILLTKAERDSLARRLVEIGRALLEAIADSARCESDLIVRAIPRGDTTAVLEVAAEGTYVLEDLDPGVYFIEAYRDVDANGVWSPTDPLVRFPAAVEVRPAHRAGGVELLFPCEVSDAR